jgi:hypothetical protein
MTAGESSGQQAGASARAQRDWRPGDDLTALEDEMLRKAEIGELVDFGNSACDLVARQV